MKLFRKLTMIVLTRAVAVISLGSRYWRRAVELREVTSVIPVIAAAGMPMHDAPSFDFKRRVEAVVCGIRSPILSAMNIAL